MIEEDSENGSQLQANSTDAISSSYVTSQGEIDIPVNPDKTHPDTDPMTAGRAQSSAQNGTSILKRKRASSEVSPCVDGDGLGVEPASNTSQERARKRTRTESSEIERGEHSVIDTNTVREESTDASTKGKLKYHTVAHEAIGPKYNAPSFSSPTPNRTPGPPACAAAVASRSALATATTGTGITPSELTQPTPTRTPTLVPPPTSKQLVQQTNGTTVRPNSPSQLTEHASRPVGVSASTSSRPLSRPPSRPSSRPASPRNPTSSLFPLDNHNYVFPAPTYRDIAQSVLQPQQMTYGQYLSSQPSYASTGVNVHQALPVQYDFLPPPPPPQYFHQTPGPPVYAQSLPYSSGLYAHRHQHPSQPQPVMSQNAYNSRMIQRHADLVMDLMTEEMTKVWMRARSRVKTATLDKGREPQRSEAGVQSEDQGELNDKAKAKSKDMEIEEEGARYASAKKTFDTERENWVSERRLLEEENVRMKAVLDKLEETIIKLEGRVGVPLEEREEEEKYVERLELELRIEGLEEERGRLDGKVKELEGWNAHLREVGAKLESENSVFEEKQKIHEEEEKKRKMMMIKLQGTIGEMEEEKRGLEGTVDQLRVQQDQEIQHREMVQSSNLRLEAEKEGLDAAVTRLEEDNIRLEKLAYDAEREMKEQKELFVVQVERQVAQLSDQRRKLAETEKEVEEEWIKIDHRKEGFASEMRRMEDELTKMSEDRKVDIEKLRRMERDERWMSETLKREQQSKIELVEQKKNWEKERKALVTEKNRLKAEVKTYKDETKFASQEAESRGRRA